MLLTLAACAGPRAATEEASPPVEAETTLANENLNSTLWVQTSAEYAALAAQSYRLAGIMLGRALQDSAWTASTEQAAAGNYAALPPAVVLDVDETVLDNTAYQARLVLDDAAYDRESWQRWVREERAIAVPGALAFTREAAAAGVQVLYLTNRRAEVEAATRRNLQKLGFPLAAGQDVIYTRGEQPGWDGDKEMRRRAIAEQHRVLLLVGDNFGDFVAGVETSVEERARLAQAYEAFWGTRWIVLPNPQYGSWDGALYDFEYQLSREEQLRRKRRRLRPMREAAETTRLQ